MSVTIDVLLAGHPIPHFSEPMAEAAESFTRAHPGYEVRLREMNFWDVPGEVARAVADGNPPDLAEYYFTATQLALDTRDRHGEPLFTPLQRAIGDRTKILGEPVVVDDLVPVVRDYYSREGELVSMPTIVSTAIVFANQDLLDRAGVTRMPRTWQELEAACARVRRLPGGPAAGVSWPNHGWMFQMEVAAQGGLIGDQDNGRTGRATRVDLESPEILSYVRWWRDMHARGHYLHTGGLRDWLAAMEAFNRQEIAFVVSSSAVGGLMAGMAEEAGFRMTTGVLPHNAARPCAGRSLGGQSLFLTAGLPREKEDAALAFLQHMANPHNAVRRQNSGSLPLTVPEHELHASQGWFERHPHIRTAVEQVTSSDGSPAARGALLGDWNGIQDAVTFAMHDVLTKRQDIVPRFRAATQEAQAALDRYTAACLADPPVTPDALVAG